MPADPRATPSSGRLATVVVVNWNGERWLGPCLTALAAQRTTCAFDVWVVDNASTDGSLALLERDHPGVRVLRNDRNLGFAGGNDTALREVTTPFAVLLNNDATPEPDWLERLLAPFDAPGADRLAHRAGTPLAPPTKQPRSCRTLRNGNTPSQRTGGLSPPGSPCTP